MLGEVISLSQYNADVSPGGYSHIWPNGDVPL